MKLIEVIKGSPIGYYTLAFACSQCGVQFTKSFYDFGKFDKIFRIIKYCPMCGHKIRQERRHTHLDIRASCGLSKDECTDDALIDALKNCDLLPKEFDKRPEFIHSFRGDNTGGVWDDVWFLGSRSKQSSFFDT